MVTLLHQSIERHAAERPTHVAFRCRGEELSYGDLHRRASQLARHLIGQGVHPMDRVGIFMGKQLAMPIALYGILAAGAAYVPIDPRSRLERLEFILRDCGIQILITDHTKMELLAKIASRGKTLLRHVVGLPESSAAGSLTSASWKSLRELPEPFPSPRPQEDDLAYIMYTSGSTGVPKGLMHTHRSGLAYARHAIDLYQVRPDDVLGNHAPLHFDISTFEFLAGPLAGATSVLMAEEELMFPSALPALIERERLTFWYSVPLALIQLASSPQLAEHDLSSLRWILFGGEPFPPKYLAQLMESLPSASFCNVYGPAEVNQCTCHIVNRESFDPDAPIPIGRVWDGARAVILVDHDQPAPAGQAGQLAVSSPTMMQGYWGRPDLNANAFHVEEPLPGFTRRYYRTGDIFRQDPDGTLHFLGRNDRQVKLRGYRIELDEVEAAFTAQSNVKEAAAFLSTLGGEEKHIVTAILPATAESFDPADALKLAKQRLPHYALPSRVEVLSDFPRTTSGKIDRRRLAESYETAPAS